MTPLRAIRAKCIDCCCGDRNEVRLCPCSDCPLHEFRMGHNPNRKGPDLSEEQINVMVERLNKARKAKQRVSSEENETQENEGVLHE